MPATVAEAQATLAVDQTADLAGHLAAEAAVTEDATTIGSASIIDKHSARDDSTAPSSLLLAARQLRQSFYDNSDSSDGGEQLVIHQFHIEKLSVHRKIEKTHEAAQHRASRAIRVSRG